jgi:phosphate-selective porin OprO/OprP
MNFNKKLATAVSGAVLLMAGQIALADSTTDIVDALVSKGVLTEEEGKLISKGHESKKKAEGTVGFNNGFKINSGDGKSNFSVNGRIQADYRYFDTKETVANAAPTGANNADTFDIRRAYLGVKGTFRNWVNFEATVDAAGSSAYVKYYWLETAFSDKFKVRFGQFKPGFGLEQLTSSRFIDMTERDWAASIAPGVNKGIMIHGVPTAGITYALTVSNGSVGTYISDSGQKAIEGSNNGDGKQISGRLTANIAELMGNKEAIMHIGGSYASDNDAPTSAVGALDFRTNARGTGFFGTSVRSATAMFTTPDITRYGLEGIGSYGPVKLQAEYAKMDLSEGTGHADADVKAYYVNLSWLVTGETYASAYKNGLMDRLTPKNNFTGLDSSGLGAIELGLRYSKFDASGFISGTDYAATGSSDNVDSYTAGIKWITDPNTRFMLNYVYTDFNKYIVGNSAGAVVAGTSAFNNEKAINFRAQFDF